MLRIRLQRFGKKKAPMYRISVMEKATKRDGKPVEVIGLYNPKTKDLHLNSERLKYWLGVGAQPSDTAKGIIKKEITHDLANGPAVYKAKTRKEKEEIKATLKTKPSKKKREKEKSAAEAKKAEAQKAKEEAEAPKEEAKAEEAPAAEAKAEA